MQQLLTSLQIYMPFTFGMGTGKDVLAIDIYNFIRANQNDIGGAVLICIAIDFMLSWHTRRFQYSL